ncbi:MAG: cysteine hydrolase, partial [Alphaproteobacteria bacterium]|nr:cysteine hydrolase [Alphaproteobacteria bacterium]
HELDDGSTGTELAFDPAPHAEVYTKGVYSCLSEAFLQRLTQLGVKEVHLCGMDTNCCVLKTAVDLFERGFRPVLLSKFCASHSGDAYHDMALKLLEKLIGPGQIV